MNENLVSNNKNTTLVEFLVEDLKETGEHLRDTDRKLSLLIQVYAGAFVLVATLSVNGIVQPSLFLDTPGLLLSLFLFLFTLWLFTYSLKSKELKVIYIRRMNFLRREMHLKLNTPHIELPGFWADVGDYIKTNKVGLDDLYPLALRWMVVLFGISSIYVLNIMLCKYSTIKPLDDFYLFCAYILVAVIVFVITQIQKNKSETNIKKKIESFRKSSDSQDKG